MHLHRPSNKNEIPISYENAMDIIPDQDVRQIIATVHLGIIKCTSH